MNRSKRLVTLALNKHDNSVRDRLNLPKYESTQGTTRYHRTQYWKAIQKLNENHDFEESEADPFEDSGSEYLPSNLTVLSDMTSATPAGSNAWGEILEQTIFSDPKDYEQNQTDTVKNFSEENSVMESASISTEIVATDDAEDITDNLVSNDKEYCSNKEYINQLQQDRMETSKINHEETNVRNEFINIDDVEAGNDLSSECIKIRTSKKNILNGKRQRDKRHCCYLCYKVVCNLPRHFLTIHSEDTAIARILTLPIGSSRRRQEFGKLQRTGDFYHNCEVLRFKKGELILLRVPTPQEMSKYTYHDYGPCPDCLGFMLKKHISIHLKQNNCPEKTMLQNRNPISQCNSLLNGIYGPNIRDDFLTNIVNKMKNDIITKICKDDQLILKFGSMIYEKYNVSQSELIRQSMRQLGRLLQEINKRIPKLSLGECIVPDKIDVVIDATRSLCCVSTSSVSRPEFGTPSLGLKIGHHLKKCASIERGTAFIEIMELEWNIKVSSNALHTLYKRKFNGPQLLPLTTDLLKLNKYLETQMKLCKEELEKESIPTIKSWTKFASLILCRIVLFNKKRSGEAAKITIDQYLKRPLWSHQSTEELKKSLTDFENKLAEKLVLIDVEGKRGRKVPILLTPDLKCGIDLLISKRNLVGISKSNSYIFARSSDSESHLRGHDCLTKFANLADLQAPENIKSTKLRKYIATVCQIFNLSENETDWLATHLGHNIRIHRDFYRLHESAIELTKVSRLLLAVDKGEAKHFSGKRLEDIEIKDLPYLEEEEESEGEDNTENGTNNDDDDLPVNNFIRSSASSTIKKDMTGHKTQKNQGNIIVARPGKRQFTKTPWTGEQSEAVITFFRSSVSKGTVPRKEACEECIERHKSLLASRKWSDIKFHVKNHITKISKQKRK